MIFLAEIAGGISNKLAEEDLLIISKAIIFKRENLWQKNCILSYKK